MRDKIRSYIKVLEKASDHYMTVGDEWRELGEMNEYHFYLGMRSSVMATIADLEKLLGSIDCGQEEWFKKNIKGLNKKEVI